MRTREPPQVLKDMRAVHNSDPEADDTPAKKNLRRMFDKSPRAFIDQLIKFEREHAANLQKDRDAKREAEAAVPVADEDAALPDPKTPQVQELMAQLLAEWRAEKAAAG